MKVLSLASKLSLLVFSGFSYATPSLDARGGYPGGSGGGGYPDPGCGYGWDRGCSGRSTSDLNDGKSNRQVWSKGFDINTDYEKKWPRTGITRCFDFTISHKTIYPDGFAKQAMVVNGQYLGPPIEVNWGDTVRVRVTNKLDNGNGTTIHWHGLRMLGTNLQDGVPGVTQCPIMPNSCQVYEFVATQYGTSWYHSHFGLQYPDGIVGPLIIRGPTSANYDKDLGTFAMTDWLHADAFAQGLSDFQGRLPRTDSVLFNGKGIFNCSKTTDPVNCKPELGGLTEVQVKPDTRYKMRLVSMAIDTQFTFWIDGHDFTVVANDFVPVKPWKTDTLNLGPGQRYDIIVQTKKRTPENPNFWINMRQCTGGGGFGPPPPNGGGSGGGAGGGAGSPPPPAPAPTANSLSAPNVIAGTPMNGSSPIDPTVSDGPQAVQPNRLVRRQGGPGGPGGPRAPANSHLGILRYAGGHALPPNLNDTRTTFGCLDPKMENLVPVVPKRVGVDKDGSKQFEAGQFPWPNQNDTTSKLHSWALGSASLRLNWSEPAVKLLDEGAAFPFEYVPTYLGEKEGDWNYFVILDTFTQANHPAPGKLTGPPVPHPIHLHGHDFSILAQSNTTYDPNNLPQLNLDNPPRRDVAILPGGGFLIIAFTTDNPGAWLLHCHIAWHANSGMALPFIELPKRLKDEQFARGADAKFLNQCKNWQKYYNTAEPGSGI